MLFFVPPDGSKWIIEAPYAMNATHRLPVHPGWAVQIGNAARALPNPINPFWMLPLRGMPGLKARDQAGFTFTPFRCGTLLVLTRLSALAPTFARHPSVPP